MTKEYNTKKHLVKASAVKFLRLLFWLPYENNFSFYSNHTAMNAWSWKAFKAG